METLFRAFMLIFLSFVLVSWSAPVPDGKDISPSRTEIEDQLAKNYLKAFYNMSSRSIGRSANSAFTEKIKEMQQFFGLNVTGTLDNKTLAVMKSSRCGVPDVGNYNLMDTNLKWENNVITYRLVNYTPDLQPAEVDKAIASALGVWSSASPLKFSKIDSGIADIMISFASGDHQDPYPFDGPGKTLAHAYYPGSGIGGDAHFDEDETWSISAKAINLFLVAAHEFGHSLGLSHSSDPSALMYPTYHYADTANYKLPEDDMKGIQALYGIPTAATTVASTTTAQTKTTTKGNQPSPTQTTAATSARARSETTTKANEACRDNMSIDAAFVLGDQIYLITNGTVWVKQPSKTVVKSSVQTLWKNMPTPIDAAYALPAQNSVVLFKGRQYWAFRGNALRYGYPKDISNYKLPSSVKKIDAVENFPQTRKIDFFVEDKYYRFNDVKYTIDKTSPIAESYPGLGKKVDAAFQLNGFLFVTSGATLFKYDYRINKVVENWNIKAWIGC
uniref:Matrix metalloproteinase e n=1 Tax=Cynops pyrrhogaster TaxID=8330 RepID=Q800I1_CYNPY|nr:matrix metalloproteinase e [Cynops pyrrhogaster]